MPTYRGKSSKGSSDKNDAYLRYYLYEIDERLGEDEVFYVNLHPMARKVVNFKEFQHIKPFPAGWETYEFLSIADVLITDYSSVFFDFACTRKKIVLFQYDEEAYFSERGVYMSPRELPFPIVADVPGLLREMRSEKQYDDEAFLQTYCPYEGKDATRALCDFFVLGRQENLIASKIPDNGKENVLIYAGNLFSNGITTSLFSLLSKIDLQKRNYLLAFYQQAALPDQERLLALPEGVAYCALTGVPNYRHLDKLLHALFRRKALGANGYIKWQKRFLQTSFDREYGFLRLDHVIHYSGYGDDTILRLSTFPKNRILYVHSDMLGEMALKDYVRRDVLAHSYRTYDHVAAVSQDVKGSTVSISGRSDNVSVVRNFFDDRDIQTKAAQPIRFDPGTKATITEEELIRKLDSPAQKFISIGRFSPEKGHLKLIDAFQRCLRTKPDSELIIIGGYSFGNYFQVTRDYADRLGIGDRVTLIQRLSNPFPIVKRCDFFVLSSEYEGFGLVLLEADALGLPVLSTDVPGPRGMLTEFGGTLVENSVDGLYGGMIALSEGRVAPMHIDFDQYNEEANRRFEALLTTQKN